MEKKTRTAAIIPSAGAGRRMASGGSRKNYLELAGRPVLAHTLAAFEASPGVEAVFVVAPAGDENLIHAMARDNGIGKLAGVVAGGAERQESVANGLAAAGDGWDIVIVHDGARPLVTPEIVGSCLEAARVDGAAVVAVPVKDTIKAATEGFVRETLPRETLWAAQTPQAFAFTLLEDAHDRARKDRYLGTDESSLVERTGAKVRLVKGSYENIKITTPEDLARAEQILRMRQKRQQGQAP